MGNAYQKLKSPNMCYGTFHCLTLRKSTSHFVASDMLQDRQKLPIPISLTGNSSELQKWWSISYSYCTYFANISIATKTRRYWYRRLWWFSETLWRWLIYYTRTILYIIHNKTYNSYTRRFRSSSITILQWLVLIM